MASFIGVDNSSELEFIKDLEELKELRYTTSFKVKSIYTKYETVFIKCNNSIKNLITIIKYYLENKKLINCEICNTYGFYFSANYKLTKCCSKSCQIKFRYNLSKLGCLKRYGCENPYQSEIIKEKSKQTMLKKYGCENPLQSKEIQDKIKKTLLKKYGVTNPYQTAEAIKRCKVAYSNPKVRLKIKETWLRKYGVDHPMKSIEVYEKQLKSGNLKKHKIILDNVEYNLSGYEPQCLEYLINIENIDPKDIALLKKDGMPSITYFFNNKNRFYFPDIYIKSQNRIIEVKSGYTYFKNLEKNLAKKSSCVSNGYKFNFYILNRNGTIFNII